MAIIVDHTIPALVDTALSNVHTTMAELTNNVSSAIARSNSILSRVIADVNITLTTLSDRVTSLHEQELPAALANASDHINATTTALIDHLSSTFLERVDVLRGQCGDNITALEQAFSQQLVAVNQTLIEAVDDLSTRSHAHTLALEQANAVTATALSELTSLQTHSNTSMGLLVDRLDASDALMASSHQLTLDAMAELSVLLAQVMVGLA